MIKSDFIVIGGGVVGLSIARELLLRKRGRVLVLEKESDIGLHASGRNSGVVHAGIYYAPGSLKAKLSVEGHRLLLDYCREKRIPHDECGKVIVASNKEQVSSLDQLFERAQRNGATIERVSLHRLKEIEPEARSCDHALWSSRTSILDSKAVLRAMLAEIKELGGDVLFLERVSTVDVLNREIVTRSHRIQYEFLINAAGLWADNIAHMMGVGAQYKILPFKGIYWDTDESFARRISRLIYPAPDVNMPFLGIHVTKTMSGKVLLGPTAIPAFGRENYGFFDGLGFLESLRIGYSLLKLMWHNPNNFRRYVTEEMARYWPARFFKAAQVLAPALQPANVNSIAKVGNRAQLYDSRTASLIMDFVVEKGPDSIHVLNAVSPAFTCSIAFSRHVVEML